MVLADARTELKARGFDYLSDARANLMLNNAKTALEDEWAWPWLETTVTGVAPLTISDLGSVLYVVDTTNMVELPGVDPRDIVDIDPIVGTVGTPAVWWLDGLTTLKLYPTSTSVQLSVRYLKYSPELTDTAGSNTPLIPARYHSLWVDYAVVEAYKDRNDFAAAEDLLNDLRLRRLPALIAAFAGRNRQGPEIQVISAGSEDS